VLAGTTVVIIPTYNERDNLDGIVARTRQAVPAADILIVDDNSPDGTGELAEKLALTDGQVHVLHRTQKAGLGAAYLAGFAWALDRGYGVLVEMDADGSHDPAELPDLLAALANADLIIGSRWVRGGTVRNWPRSRAILSRGGNAYARIMLGLLSARVALDILAPAAEANGRPALKTSHLRISSSKKGSARTVARPRGPSTRAPSQ